MKRSAVTEVVEVYLFIAQLSLFYLMTIEILLYDSFVIRKIYYARREKILLYNPQDNRSTRI